VTSGEADCISSLGSGDINSRRINSAPSKSSRGRVPMRREGGETEASMALMLCVAVALSSPENESARGAPNRRRVGEEGAAGVYWLVDELSSIVALFRFAPNTSVSQRTCHYPSTARSAVTVDLDSRRPSMRKIHVQR
jgi:hypothetical protein